MFNLKKDSSIEDILIIKQNENMIKVFDFIINNCFNDCISSFNSHTRSSSEKNCFFKCAKKLLNLSRRLSPQLNPPE